jgi:hypothetical protein
MSLAYSHAARSGRMRRRRSGSRPQEQSGCHGSARNEIDDARRTIPPAETFLRLAASRSYYSQKIIIDEGIRGSHLIELPLDVTSVQSKRHALRTVCLHPTAVTACMSYELDI